MPDVIEQPNPAATPVGKPTKVAAKPAPAEPEGPPPPADPHKRFVLFQAVPAWAISMLVHVIVLLVLGLMTLSDPTKIVNVLTASNRAEEGPEIAEFTIDDADFSEEMESEDFPESQVDVSEALDITPTSVEIPAELTASPIEMIDLAAQMAPTNSTLQSLSSMSLSSLDSRSADMRKKMLREYGGNDSTEAAVAKALIWIAKHQMPNGAWTFMHTAVRRDSGGNPGDPSRAKAFNAATALALLPFLGAGQTHMVGEHKDTVRRGLHFLLSNGKPKVIGGMPTLDFTESGGNLYSHGLVAILLCEAFAMTDDPWLMGPAQAAINFTAYAQNSDGGWRYTVRGQPPSDTSVVGWHLMALKSAYMANLVVPPITIRGAINFLDSVASDEGSVYGYTEPVKGVRASTTAIGLLCRMYTGWDKNHPGLQKGIGHLSKIGFSKSDVYYNYYAAQVLRQYGGEPWEKFNGEMRDWLVSKQEQSGGAEGSWYYGGGHATEAGGRLYVTSLSTMILEVYYRHMPLYGAAAGEDDFPL